MNYLKQSNKLPQAHGKYVLTSYFLFFVLLCIILITMPFQDFILKNTTLSQFGVNMSLLPLDFTFLIIILLKLKRIRINKKIIIFLFILLNISLFLTLFSPLYIKNINLFIKLIKNIVFYAQPFIIFYTFNFFFKRYSLYVIAIKLSRIIFIILFIYTILSFFAILQLDQNPIIHATENSNMRFRLFSEESSLAATVYIVFGLVSLINMKHYIRYIFIFFLLSGLIVIASKGALITLLILTIFVTEMRYKLIIAILFLIFYILYDDYLLEYILKMSNGLNEYTSFTTRLGMILAGIISLVHFPFGTGIGTYLYYFDSNIRDSIHILESYLPTINLVPLTDEMNMYLYSAENYGTKNMFFNLIMMFGVFGIYIFYKLNNIIYNHMKLCTHNTVFKFLFWYLVITQVLFTNSLYLYHYWFAYAILHNCNDLN